MHDLHAELLSGYYSCETATLAIYNDLLCLTDSKSKIILLLLDLGAAFDTVNHESYGLSGLRRCVYTIDQMCERQKYWGGVAKFYHVPAIDQWQA